MFLHRCVGLVAALVLASSSALATDFRLTIAFDKTNPATPLIGETFAKHLESMSKGRIKVQISGPETVPSFEQLQPVAAGVFDFGLTVAAYHAGTITAAISLDALPGSLEKLRSSGMIDEIDKYYQRIGLKVVAVSRLPSNSFQIITREPVTANGDLKGRKLRGTPNYRPVTDALGASVVVMPNAETYTALEKGVVDGAGWTSIGIITAKFYEVTKYLVRPTFGPSNILILMNLNRWKGLSAEDRKVVEEAARSVEASWLAHFYKMMKDEEATLIKDHGMKITNMRADVANRVDEIMADGTWALSAGRNKSMTESLKNFAKSKGLLN